MAAKRALQIAEQNDAQLHILHAIKEIVYYNEAYDPVIAEIPISDDDYLMTQTIARMQKFCERNNPGKVASIETQWGTPNGRSSPGRMRKIPT